MPHVANHDETKITRSIAKTYRDIDINSIGHRVHEITYGESIDRATSKSQNEQGPKGNSEDAVAILNREEQQKRKQLTALRREAEQYLALTNRELARFKHNIHTIRVDENHPTEQELQLSYRDARTHEEREYIKACEVKHQLLSILSDIEKAWPAEFRESPFSEKTQMGEDSGNMMIERKSIPQSPPTPMMPPVGTSEPVGANLVNPAPNSTLPNRVAPNQIRPSVNAEIDSLFAAGPISTY